MKSLESIYL